MPESPVFKVDLLNRFTIPLSGTKFTKVQMNNNEKNAQYLRRMPCVSTIIYA